VLLVAISGHLVSLDHASDVLAPDDIVRRQRAHGRKDLRLAVADVLRGERVRRLHRDEREQLEEVVLDHVAQRAGLFVVAAAPVDAIGLGDRDPDVVDDVAGPRPLDHRVGEPEDQDVLDRLLAEVVVDPEDLRLVEDLARDAVELTRACQVVPDRLLDHDSRLIPDSCLSDPLDDRRESRGWRGAVKEPPTLGTKVGVDRDQAIAQHPEGVRVVERRADVGELL
jgi:hypothetical protein